MLRARKLASAALTASLIAMAGIGATVVSAGAAHAATCSVTQIVNEINTTATKAGGINAQLSPLTTASPYSQVQAGAANTTSGLNNITNNLAAYTQALGGCPALSPAQSQTVANAFDSLTNTTNNMASTVISKHSIMAQFGFTAPIASSLRSLHGAWDSYSFALITAAPSQKSAIASAQSSVDTSLGNAITIYEEICVPSPLYPVVLPVCAQP